MQRKNIGIHKFYIWSLKKFFLQMLKMHNYLSKKRIIKYKNIFFTE